MFMAELISHFALDNIIREWDQRLSPKLAADEFFKKMKSMGNVRLPGERRHKNRLDSGPRNINEELVKKIKSLS